MVRQGQRAFTVHDRTKIMNFVLGAIY